MTQPTRNKPIKTQENSMKKVYLCEILRAGKSKYWNRIKSHGNYKILWHSEIYTTRHRAQATILAFAKNVGVRKCTVKYFDLINHKSEVI